MLYAKTTVPLGLRDLLLFLPFLGVRRCMGTSSSHKMPAPVVVDPQDKPHTATLIFLHGLGDTGHGWAEGLRQLKLKNIKCICPTAPIQPVTLNVGMQMPSWFDIKGLSADAEQDEEGVKHASEILVSLIEEEEKKGIRSDRIMVGGFSQGGAVALYTAFMVNKPLAGVLGLSTWMPIHKKVKAERKYNTDVPVLLCHGKMDPMVRYDLGVMTRDLVSSFNSKVDFKAYDNMMHSSCPQEMQDVKEFLQTHLGK